MAIVEVIHKVISSTVNFIFLKSVITPSCFEKEHRVRHFLDSCLMTQVCIGIFFFPIRHYVIKYSCLFTVERRLLTCCYPVVICPLRDLSPKVVTLVFWRKKKYTYKIEEQNFFRGVLYTIAAADSAENDARDYILRYVGLLLLLLVLLYCQLWCTILWKAFEKVPFFNKNMKVSLRQWNLNDL